MHFQTAKMLGVELDLLFTPFNKFKDALRPGITSPGIDYIFTFLLTCSRLTYSMALDAYHIDFVNTCYD